MNEVPCGCTAGWWSSRPFLLYCASHYSQWFEAVSLLLPARRELLRSPTLPLEKRLLVFLMGLLLMLCLIRFSEVTITFPWWAVRLLNLCMKPLPPPLTKEAAATAALAAYPGWRDTPVRTHETSTSASVRFDKTRFSSYIMIHGIYSRLIGFYSKLFLFRPANLLHKFMYNSCKFPLVQVKARVEILFRFKSLCESHLAELTALVVKDPAVPVSVVWVMGRYI